MSLTPEQKRLMKGGISGSSGRGQPQRNEGFNPYNIPAQPQQKNYIDQKYGLSPANTGESPEVAAAANKQAADLEALGGANALKNSIFSELKKQAEMRLPAPTPTPVPEGGGGGGVSVSSIFSPLFKALDQQRASANSRYSSNVTGITNIYGQLIGARNDDIPTIDAAYKRLQAASESRSKTDINAMSDREASRLSNNNAVLQSMGVEDIGDVSGGVAAEGSQAAINAETMNQATRSGLLDGMSATSQDMARADAASFAFRQGEDIARLQGSREDFLQGVDNQEFQLQSQQAQAQQQAQQAQAAASARAEAALANATNKANADAAAQVRDVINNGDPLTKAIFNRLDTGQLSEAGATNVQAAYFDWMAVRGTNPTSFSGGNTRWNKGSAIADALSYSGSQLSQAEKTALMEAIAGSF